VHWFGVWDSLWPSIKEQLRCGPAFIRAAAYLASLSIILGVIEVHKQHHQWQAEAAEQVEKGKSTFTNPNQDRLPLSFTQWQTFAVVNEGYPSLHKS
jgi:hypothetical protein